MGCAAALAQGAPRLQGEASAAGPDAHARRPHAAGRYEVFAVLTKARDYGVVSLALILFIWGFDFQWLLAVSSGIIALTGVALFVDLRLSPDYASIGFFVCGLVGAALAATSGWWAVLAAVLLVLYYVLDCVDGEVARFQEGVDVKWGYYDYLFHMLIKPLTFGGVGLGVYLSTGNAWAFAAALTAGVSTLWLKIFLTVPGLLFLRELGSQARRGGAYSGRFVGSLEKPSTGDADRFNIRLDTVLIRALATNFDIGLLALLVASVLDVLLPAPTMLFVGEASYRTLWLFYYGAVLPLDFLDYLISYLRRGHFGREMQRLVALAHHFEARPGPDEDERA